MTKMILLRNLALGIVLLASARAAGAQTLTVNCTQNPQTGYLAGQLASVAANTIVQITGMCLGNVTVTTDGLAFESSSGLQPATQSGTAPGPDGIAGQLEIASARNVLVNGLTLQGAASDQPGVVYANLWIHGRAAVTVQAVAVQAAQRDGILVAAGASLVFQSGVADNIGIAGVAGAMSDIEVADGATAILGFPNSNGSPVGNPAYVPCSGFCSGNSTPNFPWVSLYSGSGTGITVRRGGSVSAYLIDDEQADSVETVERAQLHFESVAAKTVQLAGMSSAWLQNSEITGGVLALGGSSAILLGTSVSGALSSGATLQASNGSSVVLAGGNAVQGGVQIDHVSSMVQQSGTTFDAPALPDIVSGAGMVQVGSTLEGGLGVVDSQASLTWQGNLTVQQNSSMRLSGGVAITGSITLEQASNAFFNLGNGGTNGVSGGVSCVFSNVLASHVSGGGGVTPPVPTIANAASAVSPQCLSF